MTLFIGTLSIAFDFQKAKASGTIYIGADGSITPSTVPIYTLDNITYTFTDNISASITVQKDDITVNGNGYTLNGRPSEYGFTLNSVNKVTIRRTTIQHFGYGIFLNSSSYCTLTENNITSNVNGVYLSNSSNNIVSGNNITADVVNGGSGILLDSSSNNSIRENNITNNRPWYGISIDDFSSNNSISSNNMANNAVALSIKSYGNGICNNNITNNDHGIHSYSSTNISIIGNNIANNKYTGIYLDDYSSNATIYHDNFINNTIQVYFYTLTPHNLWDNDYPSGGNYWSDYNGTDANHDGIGDTPYTIDANNTDRYPLMGMFSDFNATSEQHVQTICNSTISDFHSNGTAISFNVAGENGTTGFCRISIPTILMNNTYRVFVNGAEVICTLLPCSNSTQSYLYFNYTHSAQEVTIIPEFPSFLFLLLFMIATLLTFAAFRRKVAKLTPFFVS